VRLHYDEFALGFEFSPHILIDKDETFFGILVVGPKHRPEYGWPVGSDRIGGPEEEYRISSAPVFGDINLGVQFDLITHGNHVFLSGI
jgi:hypothetical protein